MALIDQKIVEQKRDRIKKKSEKQEKYNFTVIDIFPYKQIIDDDSALILHDDGSYSQMFQIITHALNLANQEEKNRLMMRFANFNRLTEKDYKVLSTLFHIDNSKQKTYWSKKVDDAETEEQRKYAMEQLIVLTRVEEDETQKNQEHFLVINGENLDELRRRVEDLYHSHNGMIDPQPLSYEKKELLLFRLNNQNTKR